MTQQYCSSQQIACKWLFKDTICSDKFRLVSCHIRLRNEMLEQRLRRCGWKRCWPPEWRPMPLATTASSMLESPAKTNALLFETTLITWWYNVVPVTCNPWFATSFLDRGLRSTKRHWARGDVAGKIPSDVQSERLFTVAGTVHKA